MGPEVSPYFAREPLSAAAAVIGNHLASPMGGWRVGPDIMLEVFLRSEYHKRYDAADFAHMVIYRPVRRAWLEKRLRAGNEPAPATRGPPTGTRNQRQAIDAIYYRPARNEP